MPTRPFECPCVSSVGISSFQSRISIPWSPHFRDTFLLRTHGISSSNTLRFFFYGKLSILFMLSLWSFLINSFGVSSPLSSLFSWSALFTLLEWMYFRIQFELWTWVILSLPFGWSSGDYVHSPPSQSFICRIPVWSAARPNPTPAKCPWLGARHPAVWPVHHSSQATRVRDGPETSSRLKNLLLPLHLPPNQTEPSPPGSFKTLFPKNPK